MLVYCIFIFILGISVGSFLNVCIYRLPRGKSLIKPRSFCPSCGYTIAWFHNLPIVSYILLMGKCGYCKKPISIRYFFVELITGIIGVVLLYHVDLWYRFIPYWLLSCMLIVVTFIDIERKEIPDIISLPGILAGMICFTVFNLDSSPVFWKSFLNSFLGALAGGGSMFLLGTVGEFIFKKEALGGGDVKLMAMIGAFLGWKLVLLTFFIAPLFGSVIGIYVQIRYKETVIPYGPFLAMAAFVSMLYGNKILGYVFFQL